MTLFEELERNGYTIICEEGKTLEIFKNKKRDRILKIELVRNYNKIIIYSGKFEICCKYACIQLKKAKYDTTSLALKLENAKVWYNGKCHRWKDGIPFFPELPKAMILFLD